MSAPTLLSRTAYVMAVSDALADLAAEDRAELIEELDDHVAALLTDRPDADLVTELGTPQSYAADLRTAAGLTRPLPSATTRLRDWWSQLHDALPPWSLPVIAASRPLWWVARGAIVALAIAYWLGGRLDPLTFLWAALVALASVWLGQRMATEPMSRARRWTANIGNGLVALLGIWLLAATSSALSYGYSGGSYDVGTPCSDTTNLYAYDAAGRALTDVRLYDQNGQPFDVSATNCGDTGFNPGAQPGQYPYPSATSYEDQYPTSPPSSLAPLPGASVPSTPAGSPVTTPLTTPTPTPTSPAASAPTRPSTTPGRPTATPTR